MLSQLASLKRPRFDLKNSGAWFQAMRINFLPTAKRALTESAQFLKTCYVDGFKALVAGQYSNRQGLLIIVATIPVLLSVGMLVIPTVLFPTPEHQAFYHFARTLADDSASMLPVAIGAISTTLGLRIPLG